MRLEISDDQKLARESFARLLNAKSTPARVRAAMPQGFDADLWRELAQLGAFGIRVPEANGGISLGIQDAMILMEEAGRTLASGPLAESLVAARVVAMLGGSGCEKLLRDALEGRAIISIAFRDLTAEPRQWVAGGAVAGWVVAKRGHDVVLVEVDSRQRATEPNLASTPLAEMDLGRMPSKVLSSGDEAEQAYGQAIEEWKLLIAAALSGLSREALRLASAYACERNAFGQPIGSYQAIAHPLADLIVDIDGGQLLLWKALHDIAAGHPMASAGISLAAWWHTDVAARTVAQALQTFGGYGLTTEYDIHLYNLRAKAWPLIFGDPAQLLEEAGRRLYVGEKASLPDAGEVSIDFDPGEEARSLAKEVDEFFRKTLTPELKQKAHYSWEGHDADVHRGLARARLLYVSWPERLGGRGASAFAAHAAHDVWHDHEWGAHAAGTTQMVGAIIDRFGTDAIKQEVLSRIASGDVICSLGYSEPAAGSDVFAINTRAVPVGDRWRIDGQKMFTSGANLTPYVPMLTRTDPNVPKHKGLTMFILPLNSPGITVQPVHTFQDERTNVTFYDGVMVPDSCRLGEVNGGTRVMAAALELEHGGGFAKVQQQMLRAAEKKTNLAYGSMAKLFSSERFLSDANDLLDLTAPASLSKRTGPLGFLNQCYRHAHGTRIYAGTSQIHRSQIAERALGLPRTRAK